MLDYIIFWLRKDNKLPHLYYAAGPNDVIKSTCIRFLRFSRTQAVNAIEGVYL